MLSEDRPGTVREAIGIFSDTEELDRALADLTSSGFANENISLRTGESAARQDLNHVYEGRNRETESPAAPRTSFLAKKTVGDSVHGLGGGMLFVSVIIIGAILVAVSGALAGSTGALAAVAVVAVALGIVIYVVFRKPGAEKLAEEVDRGRILVFVRTDNDEEEQRALGILKNRSAEDVRICDVNTTVH